MNAKKLSSKILSAVLVFLFIVALILLSGVHVYAAESKNITYLALGDSISTGYGLKNPTADGFTYRLASATGYRLINKAVDGNTSADILDQLNNSQNAKFVSSDELADTDVITITVGGNDLMALLYAKTAEQTADTTDTAADIPAKLQNGDYATLVAAINLLTESREMYIVNDKDFPIAINGIIANLNAIITKIRSVNSHAEIVIATQYNPYVEFENAVLAILSLSAVYKGMEAGVNALNEAIVNNAPGKYTVSNVKAAFDGYTGTEDLYNAQPPAGATAINVDFHPTAAGHKLLADTFAATFATLDISDAPATVTVETPYDTVMFASVTGAGEYEVGESVTLTATTFSDGYDTVFYYWLDNSVELSDDPTEEELRAAIVSYSPTFTFTASENVSYTPVADYEENKLKVYVEGCLFEDDNLTFNDGGWGYTEEYDQVIPVGDKPITVSLDSFPKTITVEGKLYLRVGFALSDSDGNGDGGFILVEDTSITIPTAPIYNSVEYRDWSNKYASIMVVYLLHTHSYEICFDEEGHWEECMCEDIQNEAEHVYSNDTDDTCECGYTRVIVHTHTWGEWISGGNGTHSRVCADDSTHSEMADCSDGSDEGELCDACGYDLHEHNYSAATCTAPATCSCGATTGEKNPDNHAGGTELRNKRDYTGDGVDDTREEIGYSGDKYCLGCGECTSVGVYHRTSYFNSSNVQIKCPICKERDILCNISTEGNKHFIYAPYCDCDLAKYLDYLVEFLGWKQQLALDGVIEIAHFTLLGLYDENDQYGYSYISKCTTSEIPKKDSNIWSKNNQYYPYLSNVTHHWRECECGYMAHYEEHNYGYVVDDNTHKRACLDCGYTPVAPEAHEYVNGHSNPDGKTHRVECRQCGHRAYVEHDMYLVSGTGHQFKCSGCDYVTENHNYIIWKPSEYSPDLYHVAFCVCDMMSDPVQPGAHTYVVKYDGDYHWEECTDCGYAKAKQSHNTTVIVKSNGNFLYHYIQCATEGCEHRVTENCNFFNGVYMGNAAGHWQVCDTCRKVTTNAVVKDHVDEEFDEKCDVCGESVEHTEHTYEWSSISELRHQGTCACGTFVTGSHTDDDNNQKCDACNTDVPLVITNGQWVYVEYTPAENTAQVGNVTSEDYGITDEDIGKIFNAATVIDKTVTYGTDTELGDVTLKAGKTYSYAVVSAQNVHVDSANGVLRLVATTSESYDANTRFVGAHILDDGTVQSVPVERSFNACVSTWFITETSPFIILAITEESAEPAPCTEHTGGTATCKTLAICEVCGESYGELATSHDYENGICALCGEVDPSDSDDTNPKPQINNDGLDTWVVVLIIVGSVLVLACGGFAVYWFVFRKRRT